MLNPALGKLIEKYESRYELVADVAIKARAISLEKEKNTDLLYDKAVTVALNELSAEKCQ